MSDGIKLDIGCSFHKLDGYFGVDIKRGDQIDVVADIHDLPFLTSSVDVIHTRHTLEHVDDPHRCISEMYRVCKPDGRIVVIAPHFSNNAYWSDMTHKRPLSVGSFDYFNLEKARNAGFPIYLPDVNIITTSVRLIYWPKRIYQHKGFFKRTILSILNSVFNELAALNPFLCERFWSHWVGGFYEVYFELKPIKDSDIKD